MQLKIEKADFKEISLDKISEALQNGLIKNYQQVEVSVQDCPNLKEWGCPAEGISGNERIIDVGGEPYMHDPKHLGAEFDYEEISKKIGSEKSYALGAGSGAMSCLDGHCGELVINENLITSESKSIIARVGTNKKCIAEKYTARKHGGLGNVYYTDGVKGKVIKIKIKGRSGDQGSLPQAMRKALTDNLPIKDKEHIALAGIFRVLKGQIKVKTKNLLEKNSKVEETVLNEKDMIFLPQYFYREVIGISNSECLFITSLPRNDGSHKKDTFAVDDIKSFELN